MGRCSLFPRLALKDTPLGSPPPLLPASLTRATGLCQPPALHLLPLWDGAFHTRREPSEKTLPPVCWGLSLGTQVSVPVACTYGAPAGYQRELRTVGANAPCAGGSGEAPGCPEERAADQRRS